MLTGYYQKNEERFQKRLVKGIKIVLKKKNTKSINMLVNNTEIFLKNKKKNHQYGRELYRNLPEDEIKS